LKIPPGGAVAKKVWQVLLQGPFPTHPRRTEPETTCFDATGQSLFSSDEEKFSTLSPILALNHI
jgi:hypothetical protein